MNYISTNISDETIEDIKTILYESKFNNIVEFENYLNEHLDDKSLQEIHSFFNEFSKLSFEYVPLDHEDRFARQMMINDNITFIEIIFIDYNEESCKRDYLLDIY